MQNDKEQIQNPITYSYTPAYWLLRVLQGAIIGVGAILPGISGGVLCVIFGIYQPMMALLAHPIRTFKVYFKLLLPVIIGGIFGFIGLARLVELMFQASFTLAVWFFIGLIAGTLPSLLKEAGKEGRGRSSWLAFILGTIGTFAVLFLIKNGVSLDIQPNIGWFFVCGLLWGISFVVPGMSSSSVLIFLGLYAPMASGIADLSLTVILPLMAGALFIIFGSARFINHLFEKHYSVAFHTIIGFVIASTLIIAPIQFKDTGDLLLGAGCLILGIIIAGVMDKLSRKTENKKTE